MTLTSADHRRFSIWHIIEHLILTTEEIEYADMAVSSYLVRSRITKHTRLDMLTAKQGSQLPFPDFAWTKLPGRRSGRSKGHTEAV